MSDRSAGRWGGAAIFLVFLLGGCAADGTTPLSSGVAGIEVSAALDGVVGEPYGDVNGGVVFTIKGSAAGTLFYWSVSGAVPPGLTKLPANDTNPSTIPSNTFALRGTPTACGQYPLQFQVHTVPDHVVVIPPTNFTVTVSGTCAPPELALSPLTWLTGVNDSQPLAVSGGTPPYTWTVAGLPSGITLNASTGTLSGAPANSGSYPLIVTVTDFIGRSATTAVELTVRALTIADFKGTWSGSILSGDLIQLGSTQSLIGQRLSLLVNDQGIVNQGSVYGAVLASSASPLTFTIQDTAPYAGQFNGVIPKLSWHLVCDLNSAGNLNCVGHHFSGSQYNGTVILSRINSSDQDTTPPAVSNSIPAGDAQGVTSFDVTVTFSEPLSGSASVAIDGGTGVGPVTFAPTDPKTATLKLSGLQSNTSYTLTLNPDPTAPVRFMDLAGNALPTSTITFQTGLLNATTLSVTKNGTGGGTVTSNPAGIDCGAICSAAFADGSGVTLTATSNTVSVFTGWSGPCSGTGTCTVTMDAAKSVTATFTLQSYALTVGRTGTGTGTVTSNVGGISCGTACSATFDYNTAVTLTANAATGSTFAGWSGSGITCPGTGTCSVTVDAAKSVTATFTLQTYALTVGRTGTGTGTVTSNVGGISCGTACSATLDYGTNVILTATAASGSVFAGWSGSGITCPGIASCSVTMTAAKDITATFNPAPTFTLTVTKSGSGTGTVTSSPSGITCGATCSAAFATGITVTLTATPASGSVFAGWSGSGIACPGTASCSVTMTAAQGVTATFNSVPTYELIVTKGGGGTGTVTSSPADINCGATCTASFNDGTSVVLTAAPTTGSAFAGWSGDCTNASGTCTVTMSAAKAVTATFNLIPTYTLSVTKGGGGTGTVTSSPAGINCDPTCSETFNDGASVTLTAIASSGSAFAGWTGDCTNTSGTCTVTMSAARAVTATFNTLTYTLTVTKAGTGTGTVTSSPAGISCGTSCSATLASGASATLTATPTADSSFSGWSGSGCTGTGTCVVTLTTDQSVTATFTLNSTTNQPPTANSQSITIARRDLAIYNYAITLTGSPSAVRFKIVRWPAYRDPLSSMDFISGQTYETGWSDAIAMHLPPVTATTSSFVNLTTGDITVDPSGSPSVVVYTPISCHANNFSQDSFDFVAIDANGVTSTPATVTVNVSTQSSCLHRF